MTIELREEARRREEERERIERNKEMFARDLRSIASWAEGRRVFRWLLDQGDIFRADYQPGKLGAFQAGRRAAALRLWHTLREHLNPTVFQAIAFQNKEENGAPKAEPARGVPATDRPDEFSPLADFDEG